MHMCSPMLPMRTRGGRVHHPKTKCCNTHFGARRKCQLHLDRRPASDLGALPRPHLARELSQPCPASATALSFGLAYAMDRTRRGSLSTAAQHSQPPRRARTAAALALKAATPARASRPKPLHRNLARPLDDQAWSRRSPASSGLCCARTAPAAHAAARLVRSPAPFSAAAIHGTPRQPIATPQPTTPAIHGMPKQPMAAPQLSAPGANHP